MIEKKYIDYFDIDPSYYPAVTPALIQSEKVSWKKFYPHAAFIELLQKIHASISRLTPKSLWLEGAYGSGKSHAALTVKSLFEAPDEEVEEYFSKYNLGSDFCKIFLADKNAGKILIVHKLASSSIHSEQDLILEVQASIMNSLETHGVENKGENSLKEAALKWLEKKANRDWLGELITEQKYFWDFSGRNIDEIIAVLKNNNENSNHVLSSLIRVAKENGVIAFQMNMQDLMNWIRRIIEANNLKAILFIWDEFTEFLLNNQTSLTGFQSLVELSSSSPFYFLIVAHDSGGLFVNAASAKKLLDRFIPPIKIDLPDNMAFKLMAQAMQISEEPQLKNEWEIYRRELNAHFTEARAKICSSIENINANSFILDKDIQAVIPIHPYTALMLKHLSVVFGSNQRSMFDFIINDESELHAFKWFIKNFGPVNQDYSLTADMLWDFFYGKDNHSIPEDARIILNTYNIIKPEALSPEEQRVLKIILLLQAFNSQNSDVDLLRPNDNNINLAFSGTNWPEGKASSIASSLIEKGLIFRRRLSNGNFEYTIANIMEDVNAIRHEKDELAKNTNTKSLIERANLLEAIFIPEELSDRFVLRASSVHDLQKTINDMNSLEAHEVFYAIALFALNENEAAQIQASLPTLAQLNDIIFIDTSLNPLGQPELEHYIQAGAYSRYYLQKGDRPRAEEFQSQAKEYLSNWKRKISNGTLVLYSKSEPSGKRLTGIQELVHEVKNIDYHIYSCGLEHYNATASLFSSKSKQFKLGARCGITQNLSGQFLSPRKDNRLDNVLSKAWGINNYWENQANNNLPIVKAKLKVEQIISESLEQASRNISVLKIFNELRKPPFGFMPNNFTAFVMGFLLKEYSGENYFWSCGDQSEIMNQDKLAEMIYNALNYELNPKRNFQEEFITIMSQEQKAFLRCSAQAFRFQPEQLASIESLKEKISATLNGFNFPAWCVKNILSEFMLKTETQILAKAIDAYINISNDDEAEAKIGRLALINNDLGNDLAIVLTEENCKAGLLSYIENFQEGKLPKLAAQIQDNGEYVTKFINCAPKLSSQEALDQKLNDMILDYEIVEETNYVSPKCHSFFQAISEWISQIQTLKISFEVLKDYASSSLPLLEILHKLNRFNSLPPQNRPDFLEAIKLYRQDFMTLCRNQHHVFRVTMVHFIEGLSEEEIDGIFDSLPNNQFMKSASEYCSYVENEVKKYKTGILRKKLRDFWREKTGTQDPKDWSARFETPILCMINEPGIANAKYVFEILMKNSPTEIETNFALEFLKTADFFDALNNPQARDEAFASKFLKDYHYVLPDLQEVRQAIKASSKETPYAWSESETIQRRVRELAEKNYRLKFREQVFEIIDQLDQSSLQKYIKDLISENLNVGIEILKQKIKSPKV